MKYLLDTNICIYIIRHKPVSCIERFKKCEVSDIAISSITLAELEFGIEKSSRPVQNRIALSEFLAPIEICPFDNDAALSYGTVRQGLEQKGKPIGPLDTLIAAHCLALDLILVTNNMKEFRRIPGLKVENWVR